MASPLKVVVKLKPGPGAGKFADKIRKELEKRVDTAANELVQELKNEVSTQATAPPGAPPGTRTGELMNSISIQKRGPLDLGVGSYGTDVGFWQEFGVKKAAPGYPMKIHLRPEELPEDEKIYYDEEGPYIYRMRRRPVSPRPWFRPTFHRMVNRIKEILGQPIKV